MKKPVPPKSRRQSIILKRLDLPQITPPVLSPMTTRRTRRQSEVTLPKCSVDLSKSGISRSLSSGAPLNKRRSETSFSNARKTFTRDPSRGIIAGTANSFNASISKKTNTALQKTKIATRSEINNISSSTNLPITTDSEVAFPAEIFFSKRPRRESMAKITHSLLDVKKDSKIVPKVAKPPVSRARAARKGPRTSDKTEQGSTNEKYLGRNKNKSTTKCKNGELPNITTPSPQPNFKRLTRSAKKTLKKVHISASSPLSLKKKPSVFATSTKLHNGENCELSSNARVKAKKKAFESAGINTPKPEDPADILKKNFKKKIGVSSNKRMKENSAPILWLHSDVTHVEKITSNFVSLSAASSDTNLPPTPKSSRKLLVPTTQRQNGTLERIPLRMSLSPHNRFRSSTPPTTDSVFLDISDSSMSVLNSSYNAVNGVQVSSEDPLIKDDEPGSKKGYCQIM